MIDMNKQRRAPGRIPIRFADEEASNTERGQTTVGGDDAADGALTPDEIGRASIYEDETEIQRRIERGEEQDNKRGREQADKSDTAGGPHPSELPQNRNNQDTAAPYIENEVSSATSATEVSEERDDAARTAEAAASGPMLAELVATRAELRRVETELQKSSVEHQELLDMVTRRQADFENYRKRVERERSETYNRTVGNVVSHLLPVVDNLRRALDAEAAVEANESEAFRHFLHGVELISKQLNAVLDNLGVEPVATVGEPFDPHVHEAVALEENDRFAPDTVIQEMVRGYRLGDKLLRPAMVKVAK